MARLGSRALSNLNAEYDFFRNSFRGCGKTLVLGGAALPALRLGHYFESGFSR
jgi:hypothetical protein